MTFEGTGPQTLGLTALSDVSDSSHWARSARWIAESYP